MGALRCLSNYLVYQGPLGARLRKAGTSPLPRMNPRGGNFCYNPRVYTYLVNQDLWRLAQENRPSGRRGVPVEGAVGDAQAVGVDGADGAAATTYLTLKEHGVVAEVSRVDDGTAVSNGSYLWG